MAHYRFLSEIGEHYDAEEGTEGVRRAALGALEGRLIAAVMDLDAKISAATPTAPTGPVDVRQMGAFWKKAAQDSRKSAAQRDTPEIIEARAKVARLRRWLELQGAEIDANNHIDWGKSTRAVVYDRTLADQGMTLARFRGRSMYSDDEAKKPIDTRNLVTHFSGPGYAIYVMSNVGNIHLSSHAVGYRHHSSLLAGEDVAGAGELKVTNGKLTWISNKSGHYTPDAPHFLQVLHQLQKKGVDLALTHCRYHTISAKTEYNSVGDYVAEMERNGTEYYLGKMLQYCKTISFADFIALAAPKGWRWRTPAEANLGQPNGVYTIAGGVYVPPKDVTKWLKSLGKHTENAVQLGYGR